MCGIFPVNLRFLSPFTFFCLPVNNFLLVGNLWIYTSDFLCWLYIILSNIKTSSSGFFYGKYIGVDIVSLGSFTCGLECYLRYVNRFVLKKYWNYSKVSVISLNVLFKFFIIWNFLSNYNIYRKICHTSASCQWKFDDCWISYFNALQEYVVNFVTVFNQGLFCLVLIIVIRIFCTSIKEMWLLNTSFTYTCNLKIYLPIFIDTFIYQAFLQKIPIYKFWKFE